MALVNGDAAGTGTSFDSSMAPPALGGDLAGAGGGSSPVGARTGGFMSSVFIGTGASYQINVLLLTGAGAGLTAGSVSLKIRRASDNKLLDWNDMTFKSVGWTTIAVTMTEVSSTNDPGSYTYSFNTSLI